VVNDDVIGDDVVDDDGDVNVFVCYVYFLLDKSTV